MSETDKLIDFPGAEGPGEERAPIEDARDAGKALLLGLDTGAFDSARSMEELAALAEADGLSAVAELVQARKSPDPASALGAGRLAEARLLAQNLGAGLAVYDGELSGSQLRNIERALGIPVVDRTMLILRIFASRARSTAMRRRM